MSLGDYRDAVIMELADAEAALLDRIVDLTTERDAYRLLAKASIHRIHELTREHDAARATSVELRNELRRYTAAVVAGRAAA